MKMASPEIADLGRGEDRSPRSAKRIVAGLIEASRPRQWIKNLACVAGLIFSGHLFHFVAFAEAGLAFVGFCLASSAVYLFNDVCDRMVDRLHIHKRDRPIASGIVPVSWALGTSAVLAALALYTAAVLSMRCVGLLSVYLLLNVAYSVRFKHSVLLDILIIAFGFVLRVLYGAYAVQVQPTSWIALCMFFLALFLGFAKRRGELFQIGDDELSRRPVLGKYREHYLDTLLSMTATMAILCYAFYTVTGRPDNASLVVTVPLAAYGIMRYMLLVMVYGAGDSPEKLLTTDWVQITIFAAWAALCILVIYTDVRLFKV
jgi:4-hydroxybenzoate polyprenyltransferase